MKKETPATKLAREANAAINKAWFDSFHAAPELLDDLANKFGLRTMVKKNDGIVDANATLVACGAYEVLSYIKQRIALGKRGQ